MARLVFGAGLSHTPMLALEPKEWSARAGADFENDKLNLSDGRFLTYAELEAEVGTPYAAQAQPDVLERKNAGAMRALDRMADDLEAAAPDVVIIIGDDQEELFSPVNQPMIAIFYGAEIVTSDHLGGEHNPKWMQLVAPGYAMDKCHVFPGAPELGLALIAGLVARDVDVSVSAAVVDPAKAGFGHAFGFVIQRIFRRPIPVLPIMLNTYYPPNVPTARRSYAIGQAIRQAIEASVLDLRVAIIASGGLSHFIVDEQLDRHVLDALGGDHTPLLSIPPAALNSGSSEILNWVLTAGAVGKRPLSWSEYFPIYRTPAGTGVGVGFAAWDFGESAST